MEILLFSLNIMEILKNLDLCLIFLKVVIENKTISKDDEKILIKISKMKKLPYKLEFFINLIDRNTILISLVHIDDNILNLVNYSFNISIFLNYINRNIDENTRINNLSKIHNNNFEISKKDTYIYS
jgi:hypothetical protein